MVINMIDECLFKAWESNEYFFGNYVHKVIVPGLKDHNHKLKFEDDVNVWFKTRTNADIFVNCMGMFFIERKVYDLSGDKSCTRISYTFIIPCIGFFLYGV